MLELLELILNFYLLGVTFFLWNLWFQFVVYIISWICIIFCFFSPTRIAKLRKFKTKKTCQLCMKGGEGGVIQLFKPKISPNLIFFTLKKEKNCKIYSYIIKKCICCDFFQSYVINNFYYYMVHLAKQIWSW